MLFHYNVEGKTKKIPVCVEFIYSPRICPGFLQGFCFPSTSHRCAREVNWRVHMVPVGMWVCVSGPATGGHPVQGVSHLSPWPQSCQDKLRPPMTLNWNSRLEKNSFLFLLIFLNV